jgi:high-affinity Fe2+/Pb2+ permease
MKFCFEGCDMETLGWMVVAAIVVYVAVCFGKIAAKYGKNPLLYGILSIITPVNLLILGYWAFSSSEARKKQ